MIKRGKKILRKRGAVSADIHGAGAYCSVPKSFLKSIPINFMRETYRRISKKYMYLRRIVWQFLTDMISESE
jgi:hypothetical protein